MAGYDRFSRANAFQRAPEYDEQDRRDKFYEDLELLPAGKYGAVVLIKPTTANTKVFRRVLNDDDPDTEIFNSYPDPTISIGQCVFRCFKIFIEYIEHYGLSNRLTDVSISQHAYDSESPLKYKLMFVVEDGTEEDSRTFILAIKKALVKIIEGDICSIDYRSYQISLHVNDLHQGTYDYRYPDPRKTSYTKDMINRLKSSISYLEQRSSRQPGGGSVKRKPSKNKARAKKPKAKPTPAPTSPTKPKATKASKGRRT